MDGQYRLPFQYHPLVGNDIRFIRVDPGRLGSPIECHLHHVPLTQDVEYIALSYSWGDINPQRSITLNGRNFDVGPNLFAALDQLRSSVADFTTSYVWIDAICINQTNTEEKQNQIPRMVDIYRFAFRVLCWIGGLRDESDVVIGHTFELAVSMHRNLKALEASVSLQPSGTQTGEELRQEWYEGASEDPFVSNHLKTFASEIMNWFYAPWFQRLWIVQEVCLPQRPPDLCAGRHVIDFEAFGSLCLVACEVMMQYHYRCVPFTTLMNVRDRIQQWTTPGARDENQRPGDMFLDILNLIGPRETSVPHDHIYGVLGILSLLLGGDVPTALQPDYRKPVQKVWHDATIYIIKETGDLRILGVPSPILDGVPSWVWNFEAGIMVKPTKPCTRVDSIAVSADGMRLCVKGVQVGVCESILPETEIPSSENSSAFNLEEHMKRRVEELEVWFAEVSMTLGVEVDVIRDNWERGVWQRCREDECEGEDPEIELYTDLRKQTPGFLASRVDKTDMRLESPLEHPVIPESTSWGGYATELGFFLESTFAITADSSCVMLWQGAASVQKGDIVCIFLGGATPYVIRPRNTGYEMVGHCNLSGINNEDLSFEEFWGQQELQNFVLV